MKKKVFKLTAHILLFSSIYQLVFPVCSYALTTGPSQPEVQSFEPVGTTQMVDPFSGGFVYNIPLLEVEGYPINIAYHSGINMEQEASWVGLGWNINPGEINRTVRGLPDDFNGDLVEKELNIKPETNVRVGLGTSASFEMLGFDAKNYIGGAVNAGLYVNFNNYKGVGIGADVGVTLKVPFASAGVNMGIGSQTGADADMSAGLNFRSSDELSKDGGAGVSISGSTGFNSRSGLKNLSFGAGINMNYKKITSGVSSGSFVPVGLQNYVPVVTNQSSQYSYQFQVKFGTEAAYAFPNAYLSFTRSVLSFANDGSRKGYGYLYAENAPDDGIMDFSRDKEGIYNRTLPNLPLASMTYDIYSISGQGSGGSFRPFRNDIGSVFDPKTESTSDSKSLSVEGGVGNLFEVGSDIDFFDNQNISGPWQRMPFGGGNTGTLYQKAFFKQGGELTYNQQQAVPQLFNTNVQYVDQDMNTLIGMGHAVSGTLPPKLNNVNAYWDGTTLDRSSRANLLTYFTAAQASVNEVAQSPVINDFHNTDTTRIFDPALVQHPRYITGNSFAPQPSHISEFTQTLPDGRRYIYGIPAMNNVTREVTFAANESNANFSSGMVKYTKTVDDSKYNTNGTDNFYSATNTPAYAHSYLLTSVLSNDYVDVLGDGPTDDDLGTYVKFNYSLVDSDYRWRSPFSVDSAQFNPGFYSDKNDDRGSYIEGSRQQWHIKSIESKNFIAEFYISARNDGMGIQDPVNPLLSNLNSSYSTVSILKQPKPTPSLSYKLDSIKLYNKHDRYINENNAVPVKTVIFTYNYSLCPGIPNIQNSSVGTGKLTLQNIYIKYGNSNKSLLSPYTFNYSNPNPAYNFSAKDRWGDYQNALAPHLSYEYPYTRQNTVTGVTDSAVSWNLTDIKLPSGGKIHVAYEHNDYSFIQDRRTMQMFDVVGVGPTPAKQYKATLYDDANNINQYVYFHRQQASENPNLTFRENYLENTTTLYYNFDLDITGTGQYEHIKSYATIDSMGICPNDTTCGYIRLQKVSAGNMQLHPATVYGMNTARYYLPQILYPGFKDGSDKSVLNGLLQAAGELKTIWQNPFARFIKQGLGKNITIPKSYIRLQTPGLTKKGGGVRVKQLTLSDRWTSLSSSPDSATYGKQYDYTIQDDRYGTISSGVASYEPMVGGDENPFRMPVNYTAQGGNLLPAIDFYQEEPFGESFFPAAVVGYSSVKVRSINQGVGKSSQAEDEYLFYTAKDFPLQVNYTEKQDPGPNTSRSFSKTYMEEKALQGYTLKFNDMHGKAREVNNYVIHTASATAPQSLEKITGIKYNYQTKNNGDLDNTVKSFMRVRGFPNKYDIQNITLGQEMDFSVDNREKYIRNYDRTVALNLNVVWWGLFLVPIPTAFFPDKEDINVLKTQVSTKIVQQYGILKSVETFDQGARTLVENLIYDSETGKVMLSRTNNEFNDYKYDLKYPAYLAYNSMGPSYLNDGYDTYLDSVIVFNQQSILPQSLFNTFNLGDEVLLQSKGSADTILHTIKLWVSFSLLYMGGGGTTGQHVLVPRCQYIIDNNGNSNPYWNWVHSSDTLRHVYLRVLRSGKRNNSDQNVQEASLNINPYVNNVNDLFNGAIYTSGGKGFWDIKINEFVNSTIPFSRSYFNSTKDSMRIYNYITNTYNVYVGFNDYVLGNLGNNRLSASYQRLSNRDYSPGEARSDGAFLCTPFWSFSNNMVDNSSNNDNIVLNNAGINPTTWLASSQVTAYDVFGNAIEEMNPNGVYSNAQYGYNKQLPTMVATNAPASTCVFDGFEDYAMLIPQRLNSLYSATGFTFSPFAPYFNTLSNVNSKNYQSAYSGLQTEFVRYGQSYNLYNLNANGSSSPSMQLTRQTSHTGYYSLLCNTANEITFNAVNSAPSSNGLSNFQMLNGKKYLVDMWVKQVSGPIGSTGYPSLKLNGSTQQLMPPVTASVDGWYLLETTIDLTNNTYPTVALELPAGIYIDDIRFLPTDANMKCFVYDPFTFRQIAQLDENHFATMYEYDQEGLLVRVKKETSQGIMTVSESRRSNAKK